MKRSVILFAGCLCALTLSACVSREQADDKLARACAAAAGAMLPDGQTLGEVQSQKATPSPEGPDYRHITILVKQMDGWLEEQGSYECTFQESFGFLKNNYTGSIYQLKVGDMVYGKAGNEIMGTADDFLKITNAVRKSLYQ